MDGSLNRDLPMQAGEKPKTAIILTKLTLTYSNKTHHSIESIPMIKKQSSAFSNGHLHTVTKIEF